MGRSLPEVLRLALAMPLPQLTNSNLEVKKFVAFQEGFERLFDIMSSEGMLEGGSVIVKDCLLVCTNLLAGSSLTKVGWLTSVGCSRGAAAIESSRGTAVVDDFLGPVIAATGCYAM